MFPLEKHERCMDKNSKDLYLRRPKTSNTHHGHHSYVVIVYVVQGLPRLISVIRCIWVKVWTARACICVMRGQPRLYALFGKMFYQCEGVVHL